MMDERSNVDVGSVLVRIVRAPNKTRLTPHLVQTHTPSAYGIVAVERNSNGRVVKFKSVFLHTQKANQVISPLLNLQDEEVGRIISVDVIPTNIPFTAGGHQIVFTELIDNPAAQRGCVVDVQEYSL